MKKINTLMLCILLINCFSSLANIDQKIVEKSNVLSREKFTILELEQKKKKFGGLISIIAGSSTAYLSGYCLSLARTGSVPKHVIVPLAIFSFLLSGEIIKDGVENFNS